MTVAVDPEAGLARRVFRSVMRSMVRKAQNNQGAMIALFLPPDVAAELAQPGGIAADDLHLTLRVLADDASSVPPEQIEAWAADLERAANNGRVLVGRVSGFGRFNGDQAGGQDVTYATLDLPGLLDVWQNVRWCSKYPPEDNLPGGAEPGGDQTDEPEHEFNPHVTLAYGSADVPEIPTIDVRIDRITLAIGSERREYLFAGADTADEAKPAGGTPAPVAKAAWSTAFINDLPDASFLVVESGGEKDADGKTTPRSLRHFPVKDADGTPDPAHVRNALSRIPQSDLPDDVKAMATKQATALLESVKASAVEKRGELVADAIADLWGPGSLTVEAESITADGSVVFVAKRDHREVRFTDDGVTLTPDQSIERYRVLKAEGVQRYTLGVAYPAKKLRKAGDKDVDSHGDSISAGELERSAWDYLRRRLTVKDASGVGLMHAEGTDGAAEVVESYIYRGPVWKVAEQTVEPGDWLLGVVWSEDAWPKVEDGTITGYSLQGWGFRE